MDIDNRRPSTITLLQPNYGDSCSEDDQSDGEDESVPVERFLVPGDDEEELLHGLNELPPESVNVSSKIIGQGTVRRTFKGFKKVTSWKSMTFFGQLF